MPSFKPTFALAIFDDSLKGIPVNGTISDFDFGRDSGGRLGGGSGSGRVGLSVLNITTDDGRLGLNLFNFLLRGENLDRVTITSGEISAVNGQLITQKLFTLRNATIVNIVNSGGGVGTTTASIQFQSFEQNFIPEPVPAFDNFDLLEF